VGHWIVDFLPRLRALKEHPYLKVATVTELPPKNRDLLALFGIDHDRIINCDLGRRYRFRSLAVVQTGDPVHPDPNNICFVTDFLRTQGRPASAPLRLFLERDLKNRSITNRDDLSAELERRGFRRLSLSTMSIAEQRTALSAAEIVIATYGSDLQAFYMMSEGANLVELNWDPVAMDAGVAAMCSMVGVKYHVIRCEAAEAAEYRAYKKDRDFAVDMDALCQLLDRLDFQRRV
jgi:capsular polysaccharide biosynthesis protein